MYENIHHLKQKQRKKLLISAFLTDIYAMLANHINNNCF